MATYDEKNVGQNLEQVETNSDNASNDYRAAGGLQKVETHETLVAVDIENHQAFKGDDSDGKVAWTVKKILAACFLSMLYTGEPLRLLAASIARADPS